MNSDQSPQPSGSDLRIAFLLGIPHSGTTVLTLLLDQHPEILCPPEPWLALALEPLGQVPADAAPLAKATGNFPGEDRAGILAVMARAACCRKPGVAGKSLLVDRNPRYYQCLGTLAEAFPAAPFLWLVRNPLDVAASYLSAWGVDLATIIEARADSPFFADYVFGLRRLAEFSEQRGILVVRYEDLLAGLNPEMGRITSHLDIAPFEFSENLEPAGAGAAPGERKILQPPSLDRQSIGAYAKVLSREQIAVLLGALGPELWARLGYAEDYWKALGEVGGQVEDRSAELYAAAADWFQRRRGRCPDSCGETSGAAARIQALEAENRELAERLRTLENDRTGDSFRKVARHLKRGEFGALLKFIGGYAYWTGRRILAEEIWRLATGGPPKPLPRITLVTPVRNGAAHIEETLRSVLSQDYPDLEYLIVDGASTDETLAIVQRYREAEAFPQRIAQVVSEPDQGMYDALAKGFALASGEILGYLNSDDLLEPGRLRSVGQYFAEHPHDAVIYHEDIVLLDGWKFPNAKQPEGIGTGDLLGRHILFQDGVFFRRHAYEALGGVRRDLRLAGDFDLWLRLSARFPFVRRPGHVSCFRMRPGQLSADMPAYEREMDQAIHAFEALTPAWRRRYWGAKSRSLARWRQLRDRWFRPRLYFPIDFGNLPPPFARVPADDGRGPRSPVDGSPAERLLFSAMDSRFGGRELNYVYLDSRHGIAVTYPPLAPETLDGLYREHYSHPVSRDPARRPEGPSLYRDYFGGAPGHRRFFRFSIEDEHRWLPLLGRLANVRDRALHADTGTRVRDTAFYWSDRTLEELLAVLRATEFTARDGLRLLDVGCFEGKLLDRIRRETRWHAVGIEPNGAAVAVAREKGHEVWQGHAEEALLTISEEFLFDVIHLGQSIEHFDDPVRVLRSLRMLLAPGGVIVVSTPNLESMQIDWFGPTWAHWHPPYHRHVFSPKGLRAVAKQAGLRVAKVRSFSHPYWTAMSLEQNRVGLAGAVPHTAEFDMETGWLALRLTLWSKLLWDWRGRGDYFLAVLKDA